MEIISGLILLLVGGESLVRGSVTVARKFGISELMIGLTLVGFGTSTPELVTSVKAVLANAPGISVGNVVGSNIANILLILGSAAFVYPINCKPSAIRRDGIILIFSALCCVALTLYGTLARLPGLVFIALICLYVGYTYIKERMSYSTSAEMHRAEARLADPVAGRLWVGLVMAAFGIALTIYGAKLLVDGAIALARSQGISEATIGLTIVAVGTSLPELVTCVVAAFRKNTDIAMGNVIGSNIYNIWFILGITAVIHPIPVPESIITLDIWVMLAVSLLLIAVVWKWRQISRKMGMFFLLLYAAYLIILMQLDLTRYSLETLLLQLVDHFGYLGIFVATMVEGTFIPIPAEITMVPAGMLAAKGELNYWGALASGAAGVLVGSLINYWVGLRFGRAFILRFGSYIFIKPHFLQSTEVFFIRYGRMAVFMGRLLPGVKHYIAFAAGIARMKFQPFVTYTAFGGLIWVWVLLQVGFMAERSEENGNTSVSGLETILIIITIISVIFWIIKHRLMRH
ncbi:MAG: calcium/sodium antiporter [Rickettsiales bacterium]|nr:calcium/sodium antiporter [Rickettsiales bacterium]